MWFFIADREYDLVYASQGTATAATTVLLDNATFDLVMKEKFYPWLYWTAPELLRSAFRGAMPTPTRHSDVYSFAIILWEIFTRHRPFHILRLRLSAENLLQVCLWK